MIRFKFVSNKNTITIFASNQEEAFGKLMRAIDSSSIEKASYELLEVKPAI